MSGLSRVVEREASRGLLWAQDLGQCLRSNLMRVLRYGENHSSNVAVLLVLLPSNESEN